MYAASAGTAGSNPAGGTDVCVVSKRQKAKCRTIRQRNKYDEVESTRECKKNPVYGMDVLCFVRE